VLAGSGTTELIRLIALAYFGKGDRVLILKPTYGEYELACRLAGAEIVEQRARERDGFWLSTEETTGLIKQHRPKGVFICNPNNPTGQYFSRAEVETVLAGCEDSLLILDEAYVTFVDQRWSSLDLIRQGNVVILRSMTKDYSLAGLRLGYAIAGEEIISTLRRVRPPWNVNIAAQKAGIEAINANGYLVECREKLRQSQEYLVERLCRLGLPPLPTKANFFLIKVGDGKAFRQALLKQGILVRDCASFGLPEYVRIAPRTMTECQKLVSAIRALKGG
jgi:histidinol-phosphate aminotransferase